MSNAKAGFDEKGIVPSIRVKLLKVLEAFLPDVNATIVLLACIFKFVIHDSYLNHQINVPSSEVILNP